MEFYYNVENEKNAKKLAGLVFFEENDEPLEISKEDIENFYYSTQGGYDYDGASQDAISAAEKIRKKVSGARIAYCSEIDEGTGLVDMLFKDYNDTEITFLGGSDVILLPSETDDYGEDCFATDEWFNEVKQLAAETPFVSQY